MSSFARFGLGRRLAAVGILVFTIAVAAALCSGELAAQPVPPVPPVPPINAIAVPQVSTYDWVSTTAIPSTPIPARTESWADVKVPGDGFTYAVGNADPENTMDQGGQSPKFSQFPVGRPPNDSGFSVSGGRPVVILQKSDAAGTILWQRYFWGMTFSAADRATNARGISVWPAATPAETRIAICGETYDQQLPLCATPAGWPSASASHASGFIAVYDGAGGLLWTQQFFGRDPSGDCAITDVGIRVAERPGAPGVLVDFVTYCGASSHGVDLVNGVPTALNATLMPVKWFAAPVPGSAGGATDNGAGQWDGIVGRLSNSHASHLPSGVATDHHAVVGGPEQDALFGIAELEGEQYVTVGFSGWNTSLPAGGPLTFPFSGSFSNVGFAWLTFAYRVGAALVFNAAPTYQPTGNLVLMASESIGTANSGNATIARDVAVQLSLIPTSGGVKLDAICIVGTTDDPQMFSTPAVFPLSITPANGAHQGMTDGFLIVAGFDRASTLLFVQGAFEGGTGDDGLYAVTTWLEFEHHVMVGGYTTDSTFQKDLEVGSYLLDDAAVFPVPGALGTLRRDHLRAPFDQRPAVMGLTHALDISSSATGVPWVAHNLGSPEGGGASMDSRGRLCVVGGTFNPGGAGYYISMGMRDWATAPQPDGIRTDFDMVPHAVGRTDLTGDLFYLHHLYPTFAPPAPANGGTTPFCALSPFGSQIGQPAPNLKRMLIDWEGVGPFAGCAAAAILVDKQPAAATIAGTILQLAFPDPTPTPAIGAMEIWPDAANAQSFVQLIPASGPFRFQLATQNQPLPPGHLTACVQVVFLLNTAIGCTQNVYAASPGLFFSY